MGADPLRHTVLVALSIAALSSPLGAQTAVEARIDSAGTLVFVRDARGRVTGMLLTAPRVRNLRFRRI